MTRHWSTISSRLRHQSLRTRAISLSRSSSSQQWRKCGVKIQRSRTISQESLSSNRRLTSCYRTRCISIWIASRISRRPIANSITGKTKTFGSQRTRLSKIKFSMSPEWVTVMCLASMIWGTSKMAGRLRNTRTYTIKPIMRTYLSRTTGIRAWGKHKCKKGNLKDSMALQILQGVKEIERGYTRFKECRRLIGIMIKLAQWLFPPKILKDSLTSQLKFKGTKNL